MEFKHKSVLLDETIEALNIKPDGIYLDGTLGGGGHSYEICRRLGESGRLIGIDQDEAAIEAAGKRLEEFGDKVTIIRNNYRNAKEALAQIGVNKVDGIVLDLGVSSYQLDTVERGFTYKYDTPLDMRMDQRQKLTARYCQYVFGTGTVPYYQGLWRRSVCKEHCKTYRTGERGQAH